MSADYPPIGSSDEDPTDFVTAEEPRGASEDSAPVMLVVSGTRAGLTIHLGDAPIVIGRAQHCGVWMEGSGISREHVRIAQKSTGEVTVTDLKSTNGTYVNGVRVSSRTLAVGDQVRIGPDTILKFEYQTTVERGSHEQRYEQGLRDNLTGLYDRRHFLSKLREDMVRVLRERGTAAVIKISVDGLDRILDQHGHEVVELVIRRLAKLLSMGLRERDLLARWGEKKFAVLVHSGELETALRTAERMRRAVENYTIEWNQLRISTTVSAGVACLEKEDLADMQDLLGDADEYLTRAREQGGNRVVSC